jgi:hypothetical protein
MKRYHHLFQPIRIGNLEGPNRIVHQEDRPAHRDLNNNFIAVKEGACLGLSLDEQVLFNPNHAVLNDLPLDVRVQLGMRVEAS